VPSPDAGADSGTDAAGKDSGNGADSGSGVDAGESDTGSGTGTLIAAKTCSSVDVQDALNRASSGDIVAVPAGACTWTSNVDFGSKAITLRGAGIGATTITNDIAGSQTHLIHLTQDSTTPTRITGFTFTGGSYDHRMISTSGTSASRTVRIDHNRYEANDTAIFIDHWGNAPCLIDHNDLNAPTNSEMIHNNGLGPDNASGWSDDVVPGSPNAVYVEDNTFTNTAQGFWGNSAIQAYYGARTVFRHNSLTMSQVDQHGTPGMIGARWWEIYENTFHVTYTPNFNQCCYMQIRAGSGVIFGNHQVGVQDSGVLGTIDLFEEDSGYPALYQIGRGKNQSLDPAYVWDNDATMPVTSHTPSMVAVNRDYYLSAKPGYTPYIYPHPLAK
jgi:hypothetical protein